MDQDINNGVANCTHCEYSGNDGCGPGTVMLCLHPYFDDKDSYAGAIITHNRKDGGIMSKECPIIHNKVPDQKAEELQIDLMNEKEKSKRLVNVIKSMDETHKNLMLILNKNIEINTVKFMRKLVEDPNYFKF